MVDHSVQYRGSGGGPINRHAAEVPALLAYDPDQPGAAQPGLHILCSGHCWLAYHAL